MNANKTPPAGDTTAQDKPAGSNAAAPATAAAPDGAPDGTPPMMRAIEITAPGGPDALQMTMRPRPVPKPGEVLIRVDAAGVNRPDILQRMGLYPPPEGASDLPGLEVAGTIAALGEGVTEAGAGSDQGSGQDLGQGSGQSLVLRPGQPVCALLTGGGYAEYAIADAGSCLPVPGRLSQEEAAGLPETVFTVWANVFDDIAHGGAGLQAGETLLVHGGTSGIGTTAIALARARGATIFATASSDEKRARIGEMGADLALDYRGDDWEKIMSDAGGVDVVLDMAGGDFVARNMVALKPGGRHVSIAFLRGTDATINMMTIMRKRLRLMGSTMKARSFAEKARLARAIRDEIWPIYESGQARPVLERVFPLAEASAAHALIEAGDHTGKIILSVHDTGEPRPARRTR